MDYPTLYKRSSKGKIVVWWMELDEDGERYRTHSGQKDGKIKATGWTYPNPKNVGKANETDQITQCRLEIDAKYEKQLKLAYFKSEADVDRKRFFQPMLAEKFMEQCDKISYPVLVQRKLNGTRCVIHGEIDGIESGAGAFSRKGEQYFCVEHIIRDLTKIHARYPNLVFDGELFKHGVPLNEIASLVSVNRKAKDVTDEDRNKARQIIQFHIYDCWNADHPEWTNIQRLTFLKSIFKELKFEFCVLVDTEEVNGFSAVKNRMDEYVNDGYEGAIIRIPDGKYENKRSRNLLKLKQFYDQEYEVVDIEASQKGDWAGKAKRIICKLPDGRTFASNIRGSMKELEHLFLTKSEHIGKLATVEYQELSPYGVPLIPYTQLPFRDYE